MYLCVYVFVCLHREEEGGWKDALMQVMQMSKMLTTDEFG